MKKLLPFPSPTSHFPRKCRGYVELTGPAAVAASAVAENSTREISERLKVCRWPSLKTMTMVAWPALGAGGAAAKPLGTTRQSNAAKPATLTNFRMGFSFAIGGATQVHARPRQH